MKIHINYLFTSIFLLTSLTVFAQKKITEGQFFYTIHATFDGKKTGEGKAVFLQREKQQRLDIFVDNEKESLVFSIWIDLEKQTYFKSASNERDTSGTLNELAFMNDKRLLAFKKDTKAQKKIQGISTTKQSCETNILSWPDLLKLEAYTVNKSDIDIHYALRLLLSEFDLHGLPLSFKLYSGKTMEITLELEKIEYDRPDLVWFDPKLTPHYPFAIRKEEDNVEYDQVPKRLNNLIWNRSFEANEWMTQYNEFLFQGMLSAEKAGVLLMEDSVSNKLSQFHSDKKELIDVLEELSTQLGEYNYRKNPEDMVAAKEVFNAKSIAQLNNHFLKYIELGKSIAVDISTVLNQSKEDLTAFEEHLDQMHPQQQFGTEEAYKGMNFRQAQILTQILKQLCLEIELATLIQIKQVSTQAKLSFDNLVILSNSSKPFILLGETFETEIGIGALLQGAKFRATVNNRPLAVRNGNVQYKIRPSNVGTHSYTVKIEMEDPSTHKIKTKEQEFHFEVGVPSVVVAPDNMNILYVGEDNPVSVAVGGISSNNIEVRVSGAGDGSLTKIAYGKYNVLVSEVTAKDEFCYIEVWDKKNNKKLGSYPFKVLQR